MLHGIDLGLIDPRTSQPLQINNQLTLPAMATFIAGMTLTYVTFPPMGMVLIMVLGVGLAERSGLLAAALRGGLAIAPRRLLTPLVVLVSILAHVPRTLGRRPRRPGRRRGLAWAAWPAVSPLRASDGSITGAGSPLMRGLTPLLLLLTATPALVYGRVAGTLRTHREAIDGMTTTMGSMSYYLVMVFFAALFTKAFADSNLGAAIAVKGADVLRSLGLPGAVTLIGVILLTFSLDVIVPSASAKWAMLAPILVPMLMGVGLSPHLTQAAFRIGDGPMNLMSPLFPYFPLVLAFCRRYVKSCGLGTIMALVLPLGLMYLALQTLLLLVWFAFGLPLGMGAGYAYP